MTPLLVLLGTIAGAWYLLIVRPQKDQQTRHGRLVERLQVGDHVLTVGGIYGRVVAVESATVVLELAPGLTSRIATDGIARIVHGAEAALPTQATYDGAPTPSLPPMAMEDDMHQHPHEHPHQHAPASQPAMAQYAPTTVMPQQPFAQPAPAPHYPPPVAPAPVAPEAYHVGPPAQLPAPAAPGAPTTLRAQVVPAQTYEPRPWGDMQPRGAQQPAPHAQFAPPAPPAQYQPPVPYAQPVQPHPPVQYAQPHAPHGYAPQYAPPQPQPQPQPQYAQPQPGFVPPPAPMPVHVPFSQPATPQPGQALQYQPQAAQPMPVAPGMQAPQQLATPQAGQLQHAHHHPHSHAEPAQPEIDNRRYSRAPKGMGSSLRLDDPTLADTIARARNERADLAVEYRKLTAPLVAVDEPAHQHGHAPAHAPQLVGHDPSGVPLFATPGVPGVFPLEQYPAPAHVAVEHGMPRPGVSPHGESADPALQNNAFQRPAPYAPPRPEAPAASTGHAHSHA